MDWGGWGKVWNYHQSRSRIIVEWVCSGLVVWMMSVVVSGDGVGVE